MKSGETPNPKPGAGHAGPLPRSGMSAEAGQVWQQRFDLATEVLLYAIIVVASWGFGATQHWVVRLLNQMAWMLAALFFLRRVVYWASGWSPGRWGEMPESEHPDFTAGTGNALKRKFVQLGSLLTWAILGYAWIAWINARATLLTDGSGRMEYRTSWLPWLPHSYDATSSAWAFECYLAVAITFWCAWEWVRGKTRDEQESYVEKLPERMNRALPFIPERAQRILWVLFANGAALALASILQRLSGTTDLLWVMPGSGGDAAFHFGAFNYRANGAQYFNLLWPICLAFWWLTRVRHQAQTQLNERAGTGSHAVLFPFGVLMGACPLISTNRVGAVLSIVAVPVVYACLALDARRRSSKHRWSLHALFASLIVFGFYLGWVPLQQRLAAASPLVRVDPTWKDRTEQYRTTLRMVHDHLAFGSGPFAYSAVHSYYLESGQTGYPIVHNDWLQTIAEWGITGSILIFGALLVFLVGLWVGPVGEPMLLGMGSLGAGMVLVHAAVDFPFQVHGILLTFALLLAVLFALPPGQERA